MENFLLIMVSLFNVNYGWFIPHNYSKCKCIIYRPQHHLLMFTVRFLSDRKKTGTVSPLTWLPLSFQWAKLFLFIIIFLTATYITLVKTLTRTKKYFGGWDLDGPDGGRQPLSLRLLSLIFRQQLFSQGSPRGRNAISPSSPLEIWNHGDLNGQSSSILNIFI